MTLVALVTALMLAISPRAASTRDASAIAAAISTAVAEDAARGYVDAPLEAAVLVTYAWRESRFRVAPPPSSWDARAHVSCGAWQEPCTFVEHHSLTEQARWWLVSMHRAGLASVDSSPRRARSRLSLAMGLVGRVTSGDEGAVEAQPL